MKFKFCNDICNVCEVAKSIFIFLKFVSFFDDIYLGYIFSFYLAIY